MSPKEAVTRFIEEELKIHVVRSNGDDPNAIWYAYKSLVVRNRSIIINMLIGHYSIRFSDAGGGNKQGIVKQELCYEHPDFFDLLTRLVNTGTLLKMFNGNFNNTSFEKRSSRTI